MQSFGDVGSVRAHNCSLVLNELRSSALSRAELARRTGLSRSTVSTLIDYLIKLGLVEVNGGLHRGAGRPGTLLQLAGDYFFSIGIELGRSKTYLVGVDCHGRILARHGLSGINSTSPQALLETIGETIRTVQETERQRRLIGIGVGVASPIDPAQPGYLSSTILPDWSGIDLCDVIGNAHQLPVFVDNDANTGAMSEYWWSRREHELIFVKLGAGVGAGIISGGELHHGQAGTAGEIGHLSIDINGPKCECGQRGCLVKYIGKSALADMGRQLSLGTDDGILSRISIEASRGQEQAQAFRTQIIERFATGLISVINMFAPNAVYVSGSTDALDATFFDQLESVIASRTRLTGQGLICVRPAQFGRDAVAIGAGAMVFKRSFADVRIVEHAYKKSHAANMN